MRSKLRVGSANYVVYAVGVVSFVREVAKTTRSGSNFPNFVE